MEIDGETERERERQRQRETERQRDGERQRDRDRETETDRETERQSTSTSTSILPYHSDPTYPTYPTYNRGRAESAEGDVRCTVLHQADGLVALRRIFRHFGIPTQGILEAVNLFISGTEELLGSARNYQGESRRGRGRCSPAP